MAVGGVGLVLVLLSAATRTVWPIVIMMGLLMTVVPSVDSRLQAQYRDHECPDCGEQVRSGLVRCWRCGGFLREDIAEKYQKMLDGPQQVTYSLRLDDLVRDGDISANLNVMPGDIVIIAESWF